MPTMSAAPSLDRGYADAYNLDFTGAQREFAAWERGHPGQALGPVSEAAGLLFSELNRLGVLETRLFDDDKRFENRAKLNPDPEVKKQFDAALGRAEEQAQATIKTKPNDADSLFALTMVYGLRADYTALIDKKNLASLSYTKQADQWAHQLLAQQPTYYDGYLATGISKYIIGSVVAPVRWLLRLGGYSGDKSEGMKELELTAEHGRYLAPFARMLLAVAYLREHKTPEARSLLAGLRDEFPANPLFPREIARLDSQPASR